MLFRKKITPRCAYCLNVRAIDRDNYICLKNGSVDGMHSCFKFKYDPLKRIPPKPLPPLPEYGGDDFKLS